MYFCNVNIHEKYISRCIELGKLGIGNTYPNPSVGCCLVVKDKIIGEGFTSKAGGNHAEINAINSINDKSLLKLSTMYVTLEPCCHHGKTPPCVDKIIDSKIKKVGAYIFNPSMQTGMLESTKTKVSTIVVFHRTKGPTTTRPHRRPKRHRLEIAPTVVGVPR